ncbi:MAG: hypothetical protein KC503_17540 [Myxococcales bacterium]|nr:hypothetical protein [Myxococcales bacterium]
MTFRDFAPSDIDHALDNGVQPDEPEDDRAAVVRPDYAPTFHDDTCEVSFYDQYWQCWRRTSAIAALHGGGLWGPEERERLVALADRCDPFDEVLP